MHPGVASLRVGALLASMVALTSPLTAQSAPTRTPEQIRASYDAHQGDFDYLLGDWEFTAMSREYGKSRGYWSAGAPRGGRRDPG